MGRDIFGRPGTVYLIHFTVPLARQGTVGAQHYLGWCETGMEKRRFVQHAQGSGARITAAAAQLGPLLLVRTWAGDRYLERRMKRRGRFRQLCPECSPEKGLALSQGLP